MLTYIPFWHISLRCSLGLSAVFDPSTRFISHLSSGLAMFWFFRNICRNVCFHRYWYIYWNRRSVMPIPITDLEKYSAFKAVCLDTTSRRLYDWSPQRIRRKEARRDANDGLTCHGHIQSRHYKLKIVWAMIILLRFPRELVHFV